MNQYVNISSNSDCWSHSGNHNKPQICINSITKMTDKPSHIMSERRVYSAIFSSFWDNTFLVWTDSSSENFAGWNTSGKRTCRPSVRHRIASSKCRPPRPLSHPLLFYARRICALSICQTCRDWISKFGGYYIWERVVNIDKFTIICWVKVDVKLHVIIE